VVGVITLELQRLTFGSLYPLNSHYGPLISLSAPRRTKGAWDCAGSDNRHKSLGRDRRLQCGTFRGPPVFGPAYRCALKSGGVDCFRPLVFCILNSRTDLCSPLSGVAAQDLIDAQSVRFLFPDVFSDVAASPITRSI
jgi:hypothetical protein